MSHSSACAAHSVVQRLFPVLWEDDAYLAIGKPARVNLESPAWPHGPRVIDLVAMQLLPGEPGDAPVRRSTRGAAPSTGALIPLILPERLSSGLALFARHEEARHRFAGMAASNRLLFTHSAIVRGTPPRKKIALKAGKGLRGRAVAGRAPAAPTASARLELLGTFNDLHVARCSTRVADLDDVRRLFKAAGGLEIVGDIRPSPYADRRRSSPARRPLVHLERLSFPHPFRQRDIEIVDPTPRAFQSFLTAGVVLEEHLRSALAARLALLLDEDTDAFRLITGPHEGVGGLVAEKLGTVVVLETLEGRFAGDEQLLRQIANWYAGMLGVRTVFARVAPRRRTATSPAAAGETMVLKGTPREEVIVRENGVRFLVQPGAAGSVGLFLDQRDNRRRIAQLAAGKDLLNLFAYTCGFSVAAARAGARTTTSVDLSTGNLEWGKRNFLANDLALEAHTFIRSDAFEYLKRAERQERRFDVIVLDPPTFARAKKPRRTFEIKRHLGELIAKSVDLLRPGGHLLVSTNFRQMSGGLLRARIEEALGDRPHRVIAQPKLPIDFAADPDYQKAVLIQIR